MDWIRSNNVGVLLLAVAALFATLSINGCELADIVKVQVPLELQKGLGMPSKVTLSDSDRYFQSWAAAGERYAKNIEGGWQVVGAIQGLYDTGILAAQQAFPGAQLAFPLLTLVAGIFIKGPGTSKEKQKSYNKGLEVGRNLAAGIITATGGAPPSAPGG